MIDIQATGGIHFSTIEGFDPKIWNPSGNPSDPFERAVLKAKSVNEDLLNQAFLKNDRHPFSGNRVKFMPSPKCDERLKNKAFSFSKDFLNIQEITLLSRNKPCTLNNQGTEVMDWKELINSKADIWTIPNNDRVMVQSSMSHRDLAQETSFIISLITQERVNTINKNLQDPHIQEFIKSLRDNKGLPPGNLCQSGSPLSTYYCTRESYNFPCKFQNPNSQKCLKSMAKLQKFAEDIEKETRIDAHLKSYLIQEIRSLESESPSYIRARKTNQLVAIVSTLSPEFKKEAEAEGIAIGKALAVQCLDSFIGTPIRGVLGVCSKDHSYLSNPGKWRKCVTSSYRGLYDRALSVAKQTLTSAWVDLKESEIDFFRGALIECGTGGVANMVTRLPIVESMLEAFPEPLRGKARKVFEEIVSDGTGRAIDVAERWLNKRDLKQRDKLDKLFLP